MLPVNLRIDREGKIFVYLRKAKTVVEMETELILDVDHAGRWMRGIEMLGSVDFDLATAVKPFNPRRPLESDKVGVTYDPEANAAFFYLSMKGPAARIRKDDPKFKYSHSITPMARIGLDEQGGLVWVSFLPEVGNGNPADFLARVDAPVDNTTNGQNEK